MNAQTTVYKGYGLHFQVTVEGDKRYNAKPAGDIQYTLERHIIQQATTGGNSRTGDSVS